MYFNIYALKIILNIYITFKIFNSLLINNYTITEHDILFQVLKVENIVLISKSNLYSKMKLIAFIW